MKLNDLLPETYTYKGQEIVIDLSFDNVLDVFDVIKLVDLFEFDRAELGIILLFGEDVIDSEDVVDVWNDVFEQFIGSNQQKEPVRYDIAGNPMPAKKEDKGPVIDLVQDAEYIYSSFMQAYNMNLFKEQGDLHWFEFKALLNGLPEETLLKQIIHIRNYEPSKHDSDEYKDKMNDLKDYYRLEVSEWLEMEE